MQETYGESISNFMKWASMRIAKEVAENEKVESMSGEDEYVTAGLRKDYTDAEKRKVIQDIMHLIEEGHRVPAAAKKAGIHQKTYYNWKKSIMNRDQNNTTK
jgi:transposase-like protein